MFLPLGGRGRVPAEKPIGASTLLELQQCGGDGHNAGEGPQSSVRGVVASWFGPTPLDADWRCDRCGSPTGAKAQKCRNLPRVLVVWLQRFRREAQVEWKVEAPVRGIE